MWKRPRTFSAWLLHATRLTQPELRILYTVFGDSSGPEQELRHLSGYRDSLPVRIGNGARNQLQLDVYGEVIDASSAIWATHAAEFDRRTQKVLIGLGNYVAQNWNQSRRRYLGATIGPSRTTRIPGCLLDGAGPTSCHGRERNAMRYSDGSGSYASGSAFGSKFKHRAWNEKLQSYAVSWMATNQMPLCCASMVWL